MTLRTFMQQLTACANGNLESKIVVEVKTTSEPFENGLTEEIDVEADVKSVESDHPNCITIFAT